MISSLTTPISRPTVRSGRRAGRARTPLASPGNVTAATTASGSVGRPSRSRRNDYGLFVQDEFRLSSRATLNLGLRYEYQQLPSTQVPSQLPNLPGQTFGPEQTQRFPSDRNNFAPRLGVAYDVSGAGTTTIRGGYGIYHGRIPNAVIADAIGRTGAAQAQIAWQINPAINSSAAPVFPNTLTESAQRGARAKPRGPRSRRCRVHTFIKAM